MHLSRYLKIYPSQTNAGYFVLFSTIRSATVLIPAATLDAARDGSLQGPEQETLARLGMLVPDLDQEREQVRSLLQRTGEKSPGLKATVVLNLDCNLDCSYCYEGGFRGNLYMTEGTAQLLVDTAIRDYMAKGMDVALTYYGGEPLLSQDLIRGISLSLLEAAERYKVKYGFGLLTNGTLLNRETAQAMIPLGLKSAKFTLDGPREIHDRQRPYASGSGSFDAIVDNMAEIADLIEIRLGGNFYPETYREYPKLFDYLVERGLTPEKIALVNFTPITPQAGCADHGSGCITSSEPWLIEAVPYLREETLRRGYRTTKPMASACMVEFANTLVVNYDGSLYKCPAFMGWDGFSIGTLADGIADYTQSHCLGNWQTQECLDCAYLPMCFGGCRFLTKLQNRPLSEVDCKRDFLDATLEKLILQNLAYPQKAKKPAADPVM